MSKKIFSFLMFVFSLMETGEKGGSHCDGAYN